MMSKSLVDEILQCIGKIGGKKLLRRFYDLSPDHQQTVAYSMLKHKRNCEKMKVPITLQCLKQIFEMVEKGEETPFLNDDFEVIPGMKSDSTDASALIKLHKTTPDGARRSSSHSRRSSSLGNGNFYI